MSSSPLATHSPIVRAQKRAFCPVWLVRRTAQAVRLRCSAVRAKKLCFRDGLDALKAHIDAITVAGAQAVYLRTADAAISSAAFTSDGDLTLDPQLLEDEPLIEQALLDAGFSLLSIRQPGLWARTETVGGVETQVELDLLVGSTLADGSHRRADPATRQEDGPQGSGPGDRRRGPLPDNDHRARGGR